MIYNWICDGSQLSAVMLAMDNLEQVVRWTGSLGILATLAVIFYGICFGMQRPAGRVSGRTSTALHKPAFYILISILYFSLCCLLWRPLPLELTSGARLIGLAAGMFLFFPGLGLVLWGRLVLGKQYFVSTTFSAQLFDQHQLVTGGPFALVRHPMYLGILLVGLGGILIYRTWTMVFVALQFVALMRRATWEEDALDAEFGEQWQAYCLKTPRWLPKISWRTRANSTSGFPRSVTTLLELGLLFLPAIPAYIWLWPNVSGTNQLFAQILTYIYVILGSLVIGLRHWQLAELGINFKGVGFSLIAGLAIIIGRALVIVSVDWGTPSPSFTPLRLLGEGLYYFGLVGVGEELLFRGLLYRALEEWRDVRWAIWGSSLGFVFWHLFGQGPLVGAAMLLYGLIFALIRWRAGGILGLVFIHGLIDFSALLLLPDHNLTTLGRPNISHMWGLLIGLALIAFTPLYLWKIHPQISCSTE